MPDYPEKKGCQLKTCSLFMGLCPGCMPDIDIMILEKVDGNGYTGHYDGDHAHQFDQDIQTWA